MPLVYVNKNTQYRDISIVYKKMFSHYLFKFITTYEIAVVMLKMPRVLLKCFQTDYYHYHTFMITHLKAYIHQTTYTYTLSLTLLVQEFLTVDTIVGEITTMKNNGCVSFKED